MQIEDGVVIEITSSAYIDLLQNKNLNFLLFVGTVVCIQNISIN
ncbi:hypothetical protein LLB_1763 [Legionella longbeachae D-4968]|nr:hypothetical protein LLB_1763 [Legionella longbeachae D-4968]